MIALYKDPTWRITPSRDARKGLIKNSQGLALFRMGLWVNNEEIAHFPIVSGQPGEDTQVLLRAKDRPESHGSPLGEAVYAVGDSDATQTHGLNWSGGVGNFNSEWSAGLGPFWAGLHLMPEYPGLLDDAGIHCDWNEDEGAPGTLACVGIQGEESARDLRQAKRFVDLQQKYSVERAVVDHGLGTVPKPIVAAETPEDTLVRHKFFANAKGRASAFAAGKSADSLALKIDFHDDKFGLVLNGKQIPAAEVEAISVEIVLRKK